MDGHCHRVYEPNDHRSRNGHCHGNDLRRGNYDDDDRAHGHVHVGRRLHDDQSERLHRYGCDVHGSESDQQNERFHCSLDHVSVHHDYVQLVLKYITERNKKQSIKTIKIIYEIRL